MRELIPTLTQSGLLAVLLQRQRYKVIQLARRRAHRNITCVPHFGIRSPGRTARSRR
jgi:hypothetical protein